MLWFKKCLIVTLLLGLTACSAVSLSPVSSSNIEALASVNVIEVSGRNGQLYSRQLRDRLQVDGAQSPSFDLISKISVSSSGTLSVRGKSSTLKKMNMSVSIELLDLQTGEIVLSEMLSAGATLGTVSSYYGQDESERHGAERLARLLGDRVARRVQLYFVTNNS